MCWLCKIYWYECDCLGQLRLIWDQHPCFTREIPNCFVSTTGNEVFNDGHRCYFWAVFTKELPYEMYADMYGEYIVHLGEMSFYSCHLGENPCIAVLTQILTPNPIPYFHFKIQSLTTQSVVNKLHNPTAHDWWSFRERGLSFIWQN